MRIVAKNVAVTALERLRAQGIFDLVEKSRPVEQTPAPVATSARRPQVGRVTPAYLPDGTPTCPAHRKPLLESQYGGWYYVAKAKPGESQNDRG